ncbi:juvenile hormone acid O-methyltransferase-like [Haemaphysalis longicornis]
MGVVERIWFGVKAYLASRREIAVIAAKAKLIETASARLKGVAKDSCTTERLLQLLPQCRTKPEWQQMEGRPPNLRPGPFVELKEYSYRENLKAMQSVRFLRPCSEDDQHLDVGCGPGNFLQDRLLPHLRPCRRLVGVDSSWEMLDYAKRHCREPEVAFEHLDIERGEPQAIIDKYGQFDRVYSFLTFHYVWDLERAYRNVNRLLKAGGECLAVCFVRTGITDIWHKVFSKQQWKLDDRRLL